MYDISLSKGTVSPNDYLRMSRSLIDTCLHTMEKGTDYSLTEICSVIYKTSARVAGADEPTDIVESCYNGLTDEIKDLSPSDALILAGYVEAMVERTIAHIGEQTHASTEGAV